MMPSPDDVLERLCERVGPRRAGSLRMLHELCVKRREEGSDLSLAVLGRQCQAQGGPGERALRNPLGAPYRELIEAHRAASGVSAKRKRSDQNEDGLLEGIRDPLQRARIALLRDELSDLKRKYRSLQKVAEHAGQVTLTASAHGDARLPEASDRQDARVDLQPIERDALRDAPQRLKSVGMTVDERGRIRLPDGRVAFPVGYATAMEKIAREFGAPAADESLPEA